MGLRSHEPKHAVELFWGSIGNGNGSPSQNPLKHRMVTRPLRGWNLLLDLGEPLAQDLRSVRAVRVPVRWAYAVLPRT